MVAPAASKEFWQNRLRNSSPFLGGEGLSGPYVAAHSVRSAFRREAVSLLSLFDGAPALGNRSFARTDSFRSRTKHPIEILALFGGHAIAKNTDRVASLDSLIIDDHPID